MRDLSTAELGIDGEYLTCDLCGESSREDFLFRTDEDGTLCDYGYGCEGIPPKPAEVIAAMFARNPDDAHDDAVDGALERGAS